MSLSKGDTIGIVALSGTADKEKVERGTAFLEALGYKVKLAKNIYDKKPNNNHLYLKGKMSKCDTRFPFWKNGTCIKYGIESYYVKEKTGLELEKNLRNGTLVKVSVDKNGNAKVKGFVSK